MIIEKIGKDAYLARGQGLTRYIVAEGRTLKEARSAWAEIVKEQLNREIQRIKGD